MYDQGGYFVSPQEDPFRLSRQYIYVGLPEEDHSALKDNKNVLCVGNYLI